MAKIRSTDWIARKWAEVTPQRSGSYEEGVRDPRTPWAAAAGAASDSWKAGVTAAMQRGAFAKGVSRAGDTAWSDGCVQKGVTRWGPGVALAEGKYQAGFAPYQAAIARTTLPPRYPRRDPRNLERVRAIVEALKKVKEGTA